jgi:hypothetical protein
VGVTSKNGIRYGIEAFGGDAIDLYNEVTNMFQKKDLKYDRRKQ